MTCAAIRHKIIYRCLTPDPAQFLFFGGGVTGGTLHTPDDSLYLLVSRSDLWNEKNGMGGTYPMPEIAGLHYFLPKALKWAEQL